MTKNQKRVAAGLGLAGLFALVGGLVLVALLALVGGGGWWYFSGDEATEEVAIVDEEETTEEDALIEDEEAEAVADAGESWYNPDWWKPYWPGSDEPDDSTSDGTVADDETSDDGTSTTPAAPPTAGSTAPVVVKGIKPYGNAFPAPGKSGAMASTLTVVMGDVPNSARSQAGETETFWGQGIYQDATDGTLRATIGKKVVDPDVIRSKVGINTAWTSLPGYTGVSFRCMVIQAENGDSPAGCSRPTASTPSQVASR